MNYKIKSDKGLYLQGSNHTVTKNPMFAYQYDSIYKANNILRCMKRTLTSTQRWRVVACDDYGNERDPNLTKESSSEHVLSRGERLEKSCKERKKEFLYQKLHAIEDEIVDMLHAVEFYDFDIEDGYKMFEMIKDARVKRRDVKDAINILDGVNPSFRKYKPRALSFLFGKDITG